MIELPKTMNSRREKVRQPKEILKDLKLAVRRRDKKNIRRLLPELRKALSVSIDQFADAIKIDRRTAFRWESNDDSMPRQSYLPAIEELSRAMGNETITLSVADLEYLLQITKELSGPISLDTALELIRLRK